MEDSGRYTMIVQNKYGGESVDIVVSVTAPSVALILSLHCETFLFTHSVQLCCYKADMTFDLVTFPFLI